MSILIVYRPPYSKGNPYTGFKLVVKFRDFLRNRSNNINMLVEDFNFHVEDAKDSENLVFQNLLGSTTTQEIN